MAYTLQTNLMMRSNTNAEFQAWGKAISDAIANTGIVRESDANVGTQINWSTVAAPNAATQSMGYEIYKFADAMQATTPVYFKLEYGSGSNKTTPSLWITVGSGANGSGNVTGNVSTRHQIPAAGADGTSRASYFSGDNNRLFIGTTAGGATGYYFTKMILALERTLDATGNVTSDGLAVMSSTDQSSKRQFLWTPLLGNVTPVETSWSCLTPGDAMQSGAPYMTPGVEHVAAYPFYFNNGAVWFPPQTIGMCYFLGEFTMDAVVQMTLYNTSLPFLPLGNTAEYGVSVRGGTTVPKSCLMIRWA